MAPTKMDSLEFIRKHLSQPEGLDVTRELLKAFAEKLMEAEATALCNAGYGERTNSRNGYRERPWDTRAGTVNLEVPKLRGRGPTTPAGCLSRVAAVSARCVR